MIYRTILTLGTAAVFLLGCGEKAAEDTSTAQPATEAPSSSSSLVDEGKNKATEAMDAAKEEATQAMDTAKEEASKAVDAAKDKASAVAEKVKEISGAQKDALLAKIKDATSDIDLSDLKPDLSGGLSQLSSGGGDAYAKAVKKVKDANSNLQDQIAKVKAATPDNWEEVQAGATSAIERLRDAWADYKAAQGN